MIRRGSIRLTLGVLVGGLVTVVVLGDTWAAYRDMRASALEATSARLGGLATEWAGALGAGRAKALAPARQAAASIAVREVVVRQDGRTEAAALGAIDTVFRPDSQRPLVQVVAEDGREIIGRGTRGTWARADSLRPLLRLAAVADSGSTGQLVADSSGIIYAVAARVGGNGRVRGYVVEWRRLHSSVESRDQLNRLLGGSTRVLLANRAGDVWTDMRDPVASPRLDLSHKSALLSYDRPIGPMFAEARLVSGTDWAVVLEETQAGAVAEARTQLAHLLLIAGLAIAVGVLGAMWLSMSLTKPLFRLMTAVEGVAAGDYSRRSQLAPRSDEFGRLSAAFDAMVDRVRESFAAQNASADSERQLFESVPLPCWVYDRDTLRILAVNAAAIQHYGYSRTEFLSMSLADLRPPEDLPRLLEAIGTRDALPDRSTWRHRKKDGALIDVETAAHDLAFHGRRARIVVIHDVTDRNRATEAARLSDERYRRLVHEAPNGVLLATLDGRFISVNPAFVEMLGYENETELLAVNARDLHPDSSARDNIVAQSRIARIKRQESTLKRKDGTLVTVQFTARVVEERSGGDPYVEAVIEDVTEWRRAERQLQQAQKMEAVGSLAGGIAHDFNNLLTVILNYSRMLLAEGPLDAGQRDEVEAILQAGESAAGLTRQLLIFSRQQVVQPRVLQLNELLVASGKMLRRLIGENIEIETAADPAVGMVRADAGQIDQVIVNLAVNARDAMPDGGQLLIETKSVVLREAVGDVPAGNYVMLAVSDTGMGMDPETQRRAFDPFFTTKEVGKGTGLGLATVYAIVKQSGGFISVYSEPNKGTSFKILFPRVDAASEASAGPPASTEPAPGTETILVVEDEPAVRAIVRRVLERLGYRVLEAGNGHQAIALGSQASDPIHLLITDVIMPGMSGPALAAQFAQLSPETKVLFVSGYTDDAVVRHGVLDAGIQYLEKPFTADALGRKVRETLDTSPSHVAVPATPSDADRSPSLVGHAN